MPIEGQTKPCSHDGCEGTQTFSSRSKPPGWSAGFGGEGGQIVYPVDLQPGWSCDKEHDHWHAPDPEN